MTKKNLFFTLFFLLLIFLIYFRSPCYFFLEGFQKVNGYSLNGSSWYTYAIDNNFLNSILFVYPYAGYFELSLNLISKVASYFTKYLSLIDLYFALSVKLIIFLYIYFSNSIFFKDLKNKALIIFIILFSPPMTPEIWLTTLHIKAYFGLFSFILLFQNFENLDNSKKKFYRLAIVFSGLSSIYASVLAPIYFLRFLLEKNKEALISFFYSLLPLLINIFLFIKYSLVKANENRFSFDVGKIESFAYNILTRPFFGSSIPKYIFNKMNTGNTQLIFISLFIIVVFTFFILFKTYQKKDKIILLILSSFLLQSAFVYVGSLYDTFVGGRYAVIPGIILLTFFVRLYQIEKNYFLKYMFGFLILTSLTVGLIEFKYFSPLQHILECRVQ